MAQRNEPEFFKSGGNEIRASLPPTIQNKIKKTQEQRRRETYDPASGMIRGGMGRERNLASPLQMARNILSAIFRR